MYILGFQNVLKSYLLRRRRRNSFDCCLFHLSFQSSCWPIYFQVMEKPKREVVGLIADESFDDRSKEFNNIRGIVYKKAKTVVRCN